jgi:hypothetical protein
MPGDYEGREVFLDLGRVGDIAEVTINGQHVGVRAWAPYILEVGKACRPGANTLEVRVTNSMANTFDGFQMPSGLMGPVVIREADYAENGKSIFDERRARVPVRSTPIVCKEDIWAHRGNAGPASHWHGTR